MSVSSPWWLLALLAVPVVVWLGWRAGGTTRPRQQRAATVLRAVGVGALALALAAPRWDAAGDAVDVVFLVDGSDSVGAAVGAAEGWIAEAVAARPDDARVALARFGRDARVEFSLREELPRGDVTTVIDGSATDIARALRLGQGVLGSERRRRVVLLTDGRETDGDAVATAAELAAAGVAVDVVPLASASAADLLIEAVHAPSRVRQGEAFDVEVVVRNTGTAAADAVLVVTADGDEVDRRTITAEPGATRVRVPQVAEETRTVRYEARLASGASPVPANDVGRTAVAVDGPPRVLVVEGEEGIGAELSRALDAGGIPVDRQATDLPVPGLDRLLDYDSVVLVDVPADAIGDDGMVALEAYVREAGRGLVAIGGDDAYGLGGYDGTRLEDLLPVFARVQDPQRRPSVAEALVVDVSGSMAACHCRSDGMAGGVGGDPFAGQPVEGGVNKTDISREAVSRAVRALSAQDLVGVLAFNAEAEWVLPLQSLPGDAVVDDALARLHPDGPTDVVRALREAVAGLQDVNARLRHIVLFTDGFSEDPDMVRVAEEVAEAGVTLSIVATGEGTGEVLRRMAEAGGGRYYPGRDLFSIPDIIVAEVQSVARPIVNEGEFLPVVTGIDAATEGLAATPALLGYLATTAKPTAATLLRIGDERDPLLTAWQAGLGRTVAWTSDAAPRWSARWLTWEGFATFWSDIVKSTFPAETAAGFALDAAVTAGGLHAEVATAEPLPGDVTGTAVVTLPDGTRVEAELTRSGLRGFTLDVPGGGEGIHAVTVTLRRGDTVVFHDTVTAIRSYSPEYAADAVDPTLPQRLAAAGDGRLDPDPATAFDAEGLVPGRSSRAVWPWLALLALLTLPADVALRRLRLERGDLRRLLRGRRPPQGGAGAPSGPSSATGAAAWTATLRSRRDGAGAPPPG